MKAVIKMWNREDLGNKDYDTQRDKRTKVKTTVRAVKKNAERHSTIRLKEMLRKLQAQSAEQLNF